jgi:hypothetical protein
MHTVTTVLLLSSLMMLFDMCHAIPNPIQTVVGVRSARYFVKTDSIVENPGKERFQIQINPSKYYDKVPLLSYHKIT